MNCFFLESGPPGSYHGSFSDTIRKEPRHETFRNQPPHPRGHALLRPHGFRLPPFAFYAPADWRRVRPRAVEIFDLGLGWDITDFGSGRFRQVGLILFTIRNGRSGPGVPKTYAEKIMRVGVGQVTPIHFHWHKMEDIINRGGGDLVLRLWNADRQERLARTPVEVSVDGIRRTVKAGGRVVLNRANPSASPRGSTTNSSPRGRRPWWEVSMVNDDAHDNRFYRPAGRFPEVEEDVAQEFLLCTDFRRFVHGEA